MKGEKPAKQNISDSDNQYFGVYSQKRGDETWKENG
jgi:hypothetical protein